MRVGFYGTGIYVLQLALYLHSQLAVQYGYIKVVRIFNLVSLSLYLVFYVVLDIAEKSVGVLR